MHCTNCGAALNPGSRFCTECGRPVAAAAQPVPPAPGPAARPPVPPVMPPSPMSQMVPPVPPAPMQNRPPVPPAPPVAQPQSYAPPAPPVAPPAYVPPAPPAPPVAQAPVAPPPAPAPAPVAAAPVAAQAEAAPAALTPVPAGLGVIRSVTGGDLFNSGTPVAVYATDTGLVLLPSGGAPRVEEILGLKHAIVGDFDGDGTQDLALFSATHVWVMRYSQFGGIPSGKVAIAAMPEHLVKAPLTHDGRDMLMSVGREKVTFYVLHPSKGLVEVASAPVPAIEP